MLVIRFQLWYICDYAACAHGLVIIMNVILHVVSWSAVG
jgi:hypothetical protein